MRGAIGVIYPTTARHNYCRSTRSSQKVVKLINVIRKMTATKKLAIVSTATTLLGLATLSHAADFASPSDASGVVATFVGDIGEVLQTSLPVILAVAAALLGVMILWRFARRTIK